MGFVLGAKNLSTGERVALKFLLPSLRDDAEVSARFDQEARTAIRIKNEHVARILDVVAHDDGPFIVMEYFTGEDLAAVLRRRGPLPVDEAIDLVLQTCEAIHDAHLLGTVHRDLKPSNLFVTTSPLGHPFIKVLDFGISKSTAPDAAMTETRAVLGSPRYMSPEQLTSPKNVDARADVWSLGVIVYEMLAGVPPFPGDTYAAVSAAILKGSYAALASHRVDIPAALEEALAGALHVDRRARIPSVEALAAKLAPFGTEASRQSYARIQSRSAYARVEKAAADATLVAGTPGAEVEHTIADAGTAPAVAESKAGTVIPQRWGRSALAGVALAALGAVAVAPRLFAHKATPDVASASIPIDSAASSQAPGMSASAAPEAPPCAAGATPACEAACVAKAPRACYELAEALVKGTGVPKDPTRAAGLYDAECAAGSGLACNELGRLYAAGNGVTHDDGKAVVLYKNACDLHVADGCVNLGSMHFEGHGVPKNEVLGAELFLEGCEAGEPLGCVNVSVAYEDGKGVPKSAEKSYAFAERACAAGAAVGCVRVAVAKMDGVGVAKDERGGRAQLEGACKEGEPIACETLAARDAKGSRNVPADTLGSRAAIRKGCQAGSTRDCAVQEGLSTVTATATNPARGMAWFEDSCNKGNLVGCAMLGQTLLDGSSGTVDRPRGLALLQRACDGHVAIGCEKLKAAQVK